MKKDLGAIPAVYPMPVLMIAAYDDAGNVNVMNAAWGMTCDMDKIALFIDEDHKTSENIKKRGAFTLSIYPASMPIYRELAVNGRLADLAEAGAVIKTAFCGPCFGAGDTPANNAFSIRHSTRNFPNREGSKVQNGQIASVALMDARSIAATAANQGFLTAATQVDAEYTGPKYSFDRTIYDNRVYDGWGKADPEEPLVFGPNIKDWPAMSPLPEHLLIRVVSEIHDPVTTTDELIPSGETSSYRSNPLKLAEFALSRRVPEYVGRCKALQSEGKASAIYAVKPGDGSAREQAASCQRVLGGGANLAVEYATKRYRSNLINWGILPFTWDGDFTWSDGAVLRVPGIRKSLQSGAETVTGYIGDAALTLGLGTLSEKERQILLAGCLMNWYKEYGDK